MSSYRRRRVPGGTYFFTVRLQDRGSDLLVRRIGLLRDCVALSQARWPVYIDTAVILPDHLHMIWTLPAGDADYSGRWRLIKSAFSRQFDPAPDRRPSLLRKGEKGIWQRRFWERHLADPADLARHRAHALTAPVRAGLVARPEDWRWSSLHHRRQGALGPHAGLVPA